MADGIGNLRSRRDHDRTSQYEKRAKRRAIRQLHDAVGKNNLDVVREMLKDGDLDVNFQYNCESALQIAVVHNLEEMCELLISHGADVDKNNAEDNTLVHLATWSGYARIVELLVKHEAELDHTNNHGSTALNSAAYHGHADVASVLVAADCDVNRANKRGETALITSARTNHIDVAQVLINGGACDLDRDDFERRTALYTAAEAGHLAMVQLLVQAKCDINKAEKYRCTPLYAAAKGGHTEVVRCLVEAGAELNKPNTKACTPFLEAVRNQHADIVRILAKAGGDVNAAENEHNQSPIHAAVRIACQYFGRAEEHLSLVRILLETGCDLNVSDRQGWTPLYQSAFGGDVDIAKLLLEQNVRTDLVTETGDTPLHAAVFGNKLDIMSMIIEAGCKVNSVNKKSELPLYTAITHRANIEMVRLLVDSGSDLNVCEKEQGQCPLFAAIQQDFSEAVHILVKAGCDVNQANREWDSPLWVAVDKGNEEVVSLLLSQPSLKINMGLTHFPLLTAAAHGADRILDMLLAAGAEINKISYHGLTALQAAANGSHTSTVRRLILCGANPSLHHRRPRGRCCRTYSDQHPHLELDPLYVAVKNDNFEILQLIILASPRTPYSELKTLKEIIFRTGYAADIRLQPRLLTQYAEFFAAMLDRPHSLQEKCRGAIRETLGSWPQKKISKLPLPSKLQEYLLLKDVFHEE